MVDEKKEKNIYEEMGQNKDKFIDEDLSFDSIMQNPVLKPIAEINRSISDLEDSNFKRLADAARDLAWINQTNEEVPVYSESIFVSRFWNLQRTTGDIIKTQDIEIKTLKSAIKEILELIRKKYGVLVVDDKETKSKKVNHEDYLNKLCSDKDVQIVELAKKILQLYLNSKELTNEKKFENACALTFQEIKEKDLKVIVTKIWNLTL